MKVNIYEDMKEVTRATLRVKDFEVYGGESKVRGQMRPRIQCHKLKLLRKMTSGNSLIRSSFRFFMIRDK